MCLYAILENLVHAFFRSCYRLGDPFPNCAQFSLSLNQNFNPVNRPTQCTTGRIIYRDDEQIGEYRDVGKLLFQAEVHSAARCGSV